MANPRPIVFAPLERAHPVFEAVVPLLAHRKDGTWWASGSAFFIGEGLAITALHVLQDYSDRLVGSALTKDSVDESNSPIDYSVVADQVVNGQHILWSVRSMWAADPLDIAILSVVPAPPSRPVQARTLPALRFAPPRPGQRVFGIGFPKQHVGGITDDTIDWRQEPFFAEGVVDEIHIAKRDLGMLRFPCFRTNARFDGSMSGGPVVTDEGEVCGVICSNLPPYHPNDEHVSYASLLWPTLAIFVRPNEALDATGSVVPFRQLFKESRIRSHDWHCVNVTEDGKTARFAQS